MKIRDIMTKSVITAYLDDTIEVVAGLMKEYNIGAIPVVDENSVMKGIITDRDIVIRNIAEGKDPKSEIVQNIMTTAVETVSPETDVEDAVKKMSNCQIRRVPVVEGGALVGIAALGDVAVTGNFSEEISESLCEISEKRKRS